MNVDPESGALLGVNILNYGSGYDDESRFSIIDDTGEGAYLEPFTGGGFAVLRATLELDDGSETIVATTKIYASSREKLSEKEVWLDRYLDTFAERDDAWWASDTNDTDGLINLTEFKNDTNPRSADTDSDGMSDSDEIDVGSRLSTNPRLWDSDGDRLGDAEENAAGSNPNLVDTDRDGYSDWEELRVLNTSPTEHTSLVNLSGIIYRKGNFSGDLILQLQRADSFLGDTPQYDTNVSLINLGEVQYPYFLNEPSFKKLLNNKSYKVSAFIDSNENGLFDGSEMYAEWTGSLEENRADLRLTLQDIPPILEFLDNVSGTLQIDRGESFTLSVMAFDYPDDNWTISSAVAPRSISVGGSAVEEQISEVEGSTVTVLPDAPFGKYQLELIARDVAGSFSEPLIRQIEVIDMSDPLITLLIDDAAEAVFKWRLGEPWDAEALRNTAFIAQDFPSGVDLTDLVTIEGTVDPETLGTTELMLSVADESGRVATKSLLVEVTDQTPPEIEFSYPGPLVSLLGSDFSLPANYYSATDNLDGDLTTGVEVLGIDELDPNSNASQYLTFQVQDGYGNITTAEIEVLFEQPGFTISGFAIDGYLIGSQITFVPKSPDLQHLTRTVSTNADGGFDLNFLSSEFQALDANNNGVLDLEEGSIQALGGIDSTTNREFSGMLKADPGSTILSPLTTVVHAIMETDGATKEEALATTANAFGYPAEIDVTNFDPIQAAASGDEDSKKILQSAALVANMMKQAEVFSEIANLDAEDGEASLAIVNDLASLASQNLSLMPILAQSTEVEDTISRALKSLDSQAIIKDTDLEQFSSIASSSNQAIADSGLLTLAPGAMVGQLANRQIAVEEEVLVELEEVASGTSSLSGLATSLDPGGLLEIANALPAYNQFAPTGESFDVYMNNELLSEDALINTLSVSDGDGDEISISLGAGNTDVDGDGVLPFFINEALEIRVADAFDLIQLSGDDFDLSIVLTDSGGKTNTIYAHFKAVGENQEPISVSLFDGSQGAGKDWYKSTWMGNFYTKQNEWLFHDKLGWLYLKPNANGGFWCWDAHYKGWWWSRSDVFPYAYLATDTEEAGWLYFDFDADNFRTFEFSPEEWSIR